MDSRENILSCDKDSAGWTGNHPIDILIIIIGTYFAISMQKLHVYGTPQFYALFAIRITDFLNRELYFGMYYRLCSLGAIAEY